jgi:RNA recognition motif-containing protein
MFRTCVSVVSFLHSTQKYQDYRTLSHTSLLLKTLYITGFPYTVNEKEVNTNFSRFGECVFKFVNDRKTNQHKGYGFVTFIKDVDADCALLELNNNPKSWWDRNLIIQVKGINQSKTGDRFRRELNENGGHSHPNSQELTYDNEKRSIPGQIYLGNLPYDVKQDEVLKVLRKFGKG